MNARSRNAGVVVSLLRYWGARVRGHENKANATALRVVVMAQRGGNSGYSIARVHLVGA